MVSNYLNKTDADIMLDWLKSFYADEVITTVSLKNKELQVTFKDGYAKIFQDEIQSDKTSMKNYYIHRCGDKVIITKGY